MSNLNLSQDFEDGTSLDQDPNSNENLWAFITSENVDSIFVSAPQPE
jgi:hypothetical protein